MAERRGNSNAGRNMAEVCRDVREAAERCFAQEATENDLNELKEKIRYKHGTDRRSVEMLVNVFLNSNEENEPDETNKG